MLSMSNSQALKAIDAKLGSISMNRDEHVQFAQIVQMIDQELQMFEKLKQDYAQLKADHDKCAKQPSGADPASGPVGSEGNGAVMGEGRGVVEALAGT